jgi:predicted RND superfamily exporter protein
MRYFLQAYLSLQSFVPQHQDEKLRIIADIKERVDRKRGALEPETREKVDEFYKYLKVTGPMTQEKIPDWVLQQLRDSEGQIGRFIIMWNRGAKADYNDSKRLYDAFFLLPAGSEQVKVAANYFVLVEIIDTLHRDGPIVLGAAAGAVLVLVLLLFRSIMGTLAIMMPLVVAVAWLGGLYLLMDLKLNMFSIIAFPLLIGMGIDYGIHIYHRWHEERNVRVVLREAGGPVGLTSVTTMIGFAGLLFANHVGIETLGLTAALGIALVLVGSTLTLPALLYLVDVLRPRKTT